MTPAFTQHAHAIPTAIVSMIRSGSTIMKAYRHHAGLPIQYVASRTGLPVRRVSQIEAGAGASADEIKAINKAVGIPPDLPPAV